MSERLIRIDSSYIPYGRAYFSNIGGIVDILVVTSKIKKHIREKAQFNTSAEFIAKMSKVVEDYCNEAIELAKSDGRKTVMERDIAPRE